MACLAGLNPVMIREGRERSTRSASASIWKVNQPGRWTCLENSGCLQGHVIRVHRLPPFLDSKPVRDRARLETAATPQGVLHRAQCCPPNSGRSSKRGTGLQSPEVGCNSLLARQLNSGVGCWHPSMALNHAHAGPIPAA